MGKKVPISVENIAFERLDLSRHYLTVDCDATCFLVLNPSGEIPIEGTDICALHTGAWQIDAWKLLTKKDFPNQAGFVACLVWDKTLISDSVHVPACVESDIDTANSVSSLKGQPVNIVGFSMADGQALPVQSAINNPVYTRFHPLYFPSIVKNVPIGEQFEALKAVAFEVVNMADGGFRLTLRPRSCRAVIAINSLVEHIYVWPDHIVMQNIRTNTCDVVNIAQNQLLLTVDGQPGNVVTKIEYFLSGVTMINPSSDSSLHSWGTTDLTQLDFVEF